MRCYPKNSPRAAARVVALVLLADGHLSRTELNVLHRIEGAQDLGLDALTMQDLLQEVTEDLLATGAGPWDGGGGLHASVVASVLAEVDDGALQRRIVGICEVVAQADGHLSEGEQAVLSAVAFRWGMKPCVPC